LLKHDYVIMPIKTVRWLELVFGEGLSAAEATAQIFAEASTTTATTGGETLAAEPLIAPAQGETLPLVPSPSENGETQAAPSTESEA